MKKEQAKLHFAVHEVVVLSGFTKYMLDYLAREEIFVAGIESTRGRGLRRKYTYQDIVLLRALHAICAGKGKILHLKEALTKFRREFGPIKHGQRLEKQLFVQGNELCVISNAEFGRQLRSGQMVFSFVIDLAFVAQEVASQVTVEEGGFKLVPAAARRAEAERQRLWAPIKARRAA